MSICYALSPNIAYLRSAHRSVGAFAFLPTDADGDRAAPVDDVETVTVVAAAPSTSPAARPRNSAIPTNCGRRDSRPASVPQHLKRPLQRTFKAARDILVVDAIEAGQIPYVQIVIGDE